MKISAPMTMEQVFRLFDFDTKGFCEWVGNNLCIDYPEPTDDNEFADVDFIMAMTMNKKYVIIGKCEHIQWNGCFNNSNYSDYIIRELTETQEEIIYDAEKNGISVTVTFNNLYYKCVVRQESVNSLSNEVVDEEATEYVDLTGNCMTSWGDNGYTGNGTPAFEDVLIQFDEQTGNGIGYDAANAIDEHIEKLY